MMTIQEATADLMEIPLDEATSNLDRTREEWGDKWDSFTHIRLINMLEEITGDQYTMEQIQSVQSIRGLWVLAGLING